MLLVTSDPVLERFIRKLLPKSKTVKFTGKQCLNISIPYLLEESIRKVNSINKGVSRNK